MSNADWFARKLSTPQPQQQAGPQPTYVPQVQNPMPNVGQPSYPSATPAVPRGDRCPGCGSGNYGGATPEARKRCYDCGYPITQSGSGMGKGITSGAQAGGPTQAATQVPTGGWNPTTIIGHI
jgi:hypothetical protein